MKATDTRGLRWMPARPSHRALAFDVPDGSLAVVVAAAVGPLVFEGHSAPVNERSAIAESQACSARIGVALVALLAVLTKGSF